MRIAAIRPKLGKRGEQCEGRATVCQADFECMMGTQCTRKFPKDVEVADRRQRSLRIMRAARGADDCAGHQSSKRRIEAEIIRSHRSSKPQESFRRCDSE